MSRVAAVAVAVGLLSACDHGPPQPVPIVWDEQACAECHMHIGDPRYAAELATGEDTLLFDDPGCLLRYVATRRPHIVETWFHDSRRDRWLTGREVHFVDVSQTPMGYQLAAVGAGAAGAIGWDEAARRVAARGQHAEGDR